jgi:DNA-binding SARP family transcriptional activator
MTRERLRVHVLGRFRLLANDAPIAIPPRLRKPQALLQALIAFGGTDIGASSLIDALWPESEGDAAYHALESCIYRLRRLLQMRDIVTMVAGKVSLNPDCLWVDMWEFETELARSRYTGTNDAHWLSRVRLLYQGPFLQHEADKPWVLRARQELRDRVLNAIRDTAYHYERCCRWEEAAQWYQFGIELDPLNESLYRALMNCHQELGNHSEALQAYRRCRELLTRCLGIAPNAKTEALYFRVRERARTLFSSDSPLGFHSPAI